jgi:hypothetical protein
MNVIKRKRINMGFDLDNCEDNSYFRWNMWGFPPIRFLGELYGWIPMGTKIEAWIDDDGNGHSEEDCWYETNDGQIVCAEDAQNWAEALKEAIKDLKITEEETESQRIDDDYMAERQKIWDKEPDAIRNYFNTESDIKYIEDFIVFLEKGDFRIF